MSYSRRQLYAMGEPLGDSATYRKADGGLVLGGGGGGGGSAPAQSTTQTQDLPDWAKGYAQDTLAKGQALTDTSQNPYQAYTGQRVAGFSPLQQTAMQNVSSPEAWGKSVQGYMSPYMENVVKRQQQNAIEQAGTSMGALNAKAGQMGAFGGSGVALQRAAQDRALQRSLGDIEATGLQTAFQQGTQQANTALGQQTQLGALQQQNTQQGLDTAYQDFLAQKNYPYQQLSYMANLVRGTPMGMNQQSQVYQGAGAQLGQLAGLGLMGYGLSRMAKGGEVEGYADGGMTIMDKFNDADELAPEMDKLTEAQLQAIIQSPSTPAEAQAAKQELAMRASEDRGLGNAWEQVPYSQRAPIVRAAGGGVLAFKDNGLVDSEKATSPAGDLMRGIGNFLFSPADPEAAARHRERESLIRYRQEAQPGWFEALTPSQKAARQETLSDIDTRLEQLRGGKKSDTLPYNEATATRRSDYQTVAPTGDKKSGPRAPGVTAAPAGVSTTPAAGGISDFATNLKAAKEMLYDPEAVADRKALNELSAQQAARAGDLKKQAMNDFLMQYGAGVAQAAAKPGATFLGSVAGGAPAGISALMENRKAVAAAQDANLKMQIEQRKYNIAESKNDRTAMINAAHNMQILQQQQAQLAETIRAHKASEGLMGQRIAAAGGAGQRGMLSALGRAEDRAVRATSDYLKTTKGLQDKRSYDEILEGFRKKFGRSAAAGIGFGPSGDVYDSLDDQEG